MLDITQWEQEITQIADYDLMMTPTRYQNLSSALFHFDLEQEYTIDFYETLGHDFFKKLAQAVFNNDEKSRTEFFNEVQNQLIQCYTPCINQLISDAKDSLREQKAKTNPNDEYDPN